jgi:hypothetical protein
MRHRKPLYRQSLNRTKDRRYQKSKHSGRRFLSIIMFVDIQGLDLRDSPAEQSTGGFVLSAGFPTRSTRIASRMSVPQPSLDQRRSRQARVRNATAAAAGVRVRVSGHVRHGPICCGSDPLGTKLTAQVLLWPSSRYGSPPPRQRRAMSRCVPTTLTSYILTICSGVNASAGPNDMWLASWTSMRPCCADDLRDGGVDRALVLHVQLDRANIDALLRIFSAE